MNLFVIMDFYWCGYKIFYEWWWADGLPLCMDELFDISIVNMFSDPYYIYFEGGRLALS